MQSTRGQDALGHSSVTAHDAFRKSGYGDELVKIAEATRWYEEWLGKQTALYRPHLKRKHAEMRKGVFPFFRATFYRWVQLWPEICSELVPAPKVLAIGDLHVENFGTWRDKEGRLIWGINDFDEAYPLPYTNDLVRLAASAEIANATRDLDVRPKEACDAILTGYMKALKEGGEPLVLEEKHKNLRAMAFGNLRAPAKFWKKLEGQEKVKGSIPVTARKTLEDLMPERGLHYRLVARKSGLGSLGRYRIVAIADWRGGQVAREAKAIAPSACVWARGSAGSATILYQSILNQAVRVRDPFVRVNRSWIGRRLSPHCCRIPIDDLPKERDEHRLLYFMGWETANIHLGSKNAVNAVRRDLAKRPANWLHTAAKAMAKVMTRDWKDWKSA
jgi:hypothetical protein